MTQLTFTLADFEGPLELILHLISQHKLNIADIEISSLLEQYLAFMDVRKEIDLEVDSGFVEMAARLIHIKTVMLLPKHEDEAKDLKNKLTEQLMEYQACRAAASLLHRLEAESTVFIRPMQVFQLDKTYVGTHPISLLLKQFGVSKSVNKKNSAPTMQHFSSIISRRIISVASRIINLLKKLYKGAPVQFEQAFEDAPSRSHIVATFLGLLELIKSGRVAMDEENHTIILLKKGRDR